MSLLPLATNHPDTRAAPLPFAIGPASAWSLVQRSVRVLLGLVVTALSLVLIAWLTLHWGILPHIQQWREPLEQRASAALGVPVRIGSIATRSSGWMPSFELHDVMLLDANGLPALRLPRVFAAISPRSLMSLELRFEQLLIDGAELEIRRDAAGRIFVAGLAFSGAGAGNGDANGRAADWLFAQREFVIRGGSLRWSDELRRAPPLALTDVQIVMRNGLRHHDLRLDATPPREWGDRFHATARLTQPLLARHGDWRRWRGNAYVSLPRADVHALRQYVALPFDIREGVGALRGWLDIEAGEPQAATVDLALRAVTLRLAANVDPLTVEEVEGRLIAQRHVDGGSLALRNFSFETGDNIRWPPGDMTFAWRQREGQPVSGGEFHAQRLDVGLMAQVASRVPLGNALRKLLADVAPTGLVTDLAASWEGPLDAPARYRVKGALTDVSLASRPSSEPQGVGRPGLRGANVQLEATETGGNARVTINGGGVDLPGVFDEPALALDQLGAQLLWKIEPAAVAGTPPQLTVQIKNARFSNVDASGELTALWRSGPGTGVARGGRFPGRLELDAKLVDGVAERTYRYLPMGLPRHTREYLQRAILSGRIASANFHVSGDLWEFPFFGAKFGAKSGTDGEFRIGAKIENAAFAFVPTTPDFASPWPALANTHVELLLERGTLELRNGSTQIGGGPQPGGGRTGSIDFPKVQVAIRNLEGDAVLTLDGAGRGPLSEMVRIVNTTPIGDWIDKALVASTVDGAAELKLNLAIPLNKIEATRVKGSVVLAGNDLRIGADSPLLAGAKGRVDFTEKGFAVVGATAKLYGGDTSFEGGSQPNGALRFNGQGTVSAEGLRRATDLGPLARAASVLAGETSYRASLGYVRGQPDLDITSNLVGLSINLPAPLAKSADTPLAMRFATTVDAAASLSTPTPTPPLRDTLRFELGNLVQASFLRELGTGAPRVLRGGIGVMAPAPQPAAGVAASVTLARLATDEWQAAADRLFGPAELRDKGAEAGARSAYEPDTIALRVQELLAGPRRLTRVSAGLSQDAGIWRANVEADQLGGYIEYRVPSRRGGAAVAGGRVYARLARLSLPKGDDEQVESLLDQQPASMPALDVVVDDFELRGKHLGRLEIEAMNRSGEQGRDWQLAKLNITLPEAQFTASGHWAATSAPAPRSAAGTDKTPRRAVMDFKLQIADSGALLDRLGTPKAIRGGKGELSGQIAWLGSPFTPDYPSLAGQISVAVDSGQFLKVDPGAARLLGVLSLQSLPRRLSLDFRDLFQEGFAFDSVTGDVKIGQGVAVTHNLRMRGVQALVLMEGDADIARETQNLRVVVVPEINAGTAALAYAVINPAIGLGAFLAQAILKKPLTDAGTREFHISGPWADAKVERVERVERNLGEGSPLADEASTGPTKK